jgi:histidine triad (HIT) family protein
MKDSCIFCEIINARQPSSTVFEDEDFVVIMDIFPMSPGHCLVIPKEHKARVHELPADIRERLFELAVQVRCAITASALVCDDANYIINDGENANQEVPHVHLHVMPRRQRDHGSLLGNMLKKALFGKIRKVDYPTLDEQAQWIHDQLQVVS